MRQVLLGVFLGFVLIDLVFDLESLNGDFEAPLSFYQHRNHTIPALRMTVLLQIPLMCTLLAQFYGMVTQRTWMSVVSFFFTLAAMIGGNRVMGLREEMEKETVTTLLLQQHLTDIAITHAIMLPLLIVAVVTAKPNNPVPRSKIE